MKKSDEEQLILTHKDAAITAFIVESTIPLLADGPKILGTGTLFTHEGRHFIVTAAHILKTNPDNPSSADIDLGGIACPDGRVKATIRTIGPIEIHRPQAPSRVDVAVIELKSQETVEFLKAGWKFLGFETTASIPENARFILAGFPRERASWDGYNVGQMFLTVSTDPLDFTPEVEDPEPAFDRFFHLEAEGEQIDGSSRRIPAFEGLSGASLWAYSEDGLLWSPSKALRVVAVQSSYLPRKWFRCVDWSAVRQILNESDFEFRESV